MTPQPDALLAGSDAAPSLLAAALRMTACLAFLAAGSWAMLRWRRRTIAGGRRLTVLDRAPLSRGASVALLQVDGRHLVVGVASDGVRLLRDLGSGAEAAAFRRVLVEADTRDGSAAGASR